MDVDVARVSQARAGDERGRGDDVGEPGAHARDRRAREPRRGARRSRSGGRSARRSSGASPTPVGSACSTGLFDALGVPGENPHAADRRRRAQGVVRPRRRSPTCRSAASATARSTTGRSARPTRAGRAASRRSRARARATSSRPAPTSSGELLALLATPTIADKTWVSRQYDHQLFLNTVVGPGADAAVLRVKGTDEGARALDRRQGALLPARPAHRRAARGARSGAQRRVHGRAPARARELPQLRQSRAPRSDVAVRRGRRGHERGVRGARHPGRSAATCSFYNASRGADIHPTPVVGVIGLIDELTDRAAGRALRRRRRRSSCSATTRPELGGSEWAAVVHGLDGGMPPDRRSRRGRALHDARRRARARPRGRRRARRQRRRARGRAWPRWRSRRRRLPRRARRRVHAGRSVLRGVGVECSCVGPKSASCGVGRGGRTSSAKRACRRRSARSGSRTQAVAASRR